MNILKGSLEPTEGEAFRHHELKLAYFAQHHIEQLDLDVCALEHLKRMYGADHRDLRDQDYRARLGAYGLQGSVVLEPMRRLSGGQRSRVVFAQVTFENPHVLLLDEPTNHLDYETIHALVEAIEHFDGGVVLVSHDQYLIGNSCKTLWKVGGGRVRKLEQEFEEYRDAIARRVMQKNGWE